MPTYSTPIQPPTQFNYRQPFDIARGGFGRSGNSSWSFATAAGSTQTSVSYSRNTPLTPSNAQALGPVGSVTYDTYRAFEATASTPYSNQLTWNVSFFRPLLRADGLLGPLTDGTPTPAGATGWRYDPDDSDGGEWLGDYKVTATVRVVTGVQGRTPYSISTFGPSPILPSVTANLRLLDHAYWTENSPATTFDQWLLTSYQWPGPSAVGGGTLLYSHSVLGGTNPGGTSIGGDFFGETFTIPAGTTTLAFSATTNQLETAAAPVSGYAHPPYYADFYIAGFFLQIFRDLRPQRYQWIYPGSTITPPLKQRQRKSLTTAHAAPANAAPPRLRAGGDL